MGFVEGVGEGVIDQASAIRLDSLAPLALDSSLTPNKLLRIILSSLALLLLGAVLILPVLHAQVGDDVGLEISPPEPPRVNLFSLPEGDPVEVRANFHLLDLNRIDDEAETFEFSGVLTLIWKDQRQAFDPVKKGFGEKLYNGVFQFNELEPAWYPQVVLANASGIPETQGILLRIKPDGTCILIQTINAVARAELNLRRYPFDRQRLEAEFEILGFSAGEVELMVDSAALTTDRTRIQVPQWKLIDSSATSGVLAAPYAGEEMKSSAFVLTLNVERQSLFTVRLVLIPMILIVILSWSVFWMERSSLGDRMSVSFVGLLTVVAYQLLVGEIMPHISYVTLLNCILSFSFLIMCSTVVINLVVAGCDKRGDHVLGDRLDRRCRWVFPLIYAIFMLSTVAVFFTWF